MTSVLNFPIFQGRVQTLGSRGKPSPPCPNWLKETISSVQFSHSVVSDSLRPHESQHARPLCPSPTPGVHPNSCPFSRWCHPAISSSVVPFSSCPQSLPASESFPVIQLFTWGGQSTGVSALASFPPKKSQGWSPSERTGWISLQSKGLSRVFSNTVLLALKHWFNVPIVFFLYLIVVIPEGFCVFRRCALKKMCSLTALFLPKPRIFGNKIICFLFF